MGWVVALTLMPTPSSDDGRQAAFLPALTVARELVLFLRRPGGQDQVSVSLATQASHTRSMHELQVWMADHLDQPLSVDLLAERAAMSARNFARVFGQELGTTPGRYLLQLRVEAARRLLEQTDKSLPHVASASGFRSVDVMRRAFLRALGTTPLRYRRHFRTPAARSPMPAAPHRGPLAAARRDIARAVRVTATSPRRRRRPCQDPGGARSGPNGASGAEFRVPVPVPASFPGPGSAQVVSRPG